jgi:hypothetical protein
VHFSSFEIGQRHVFKSEHLLVLLTGEVRELVMTSEVSILLRVDLSDLLSRLFKDFSAEIELLNSAVRLSIPRYKVNEIIVVLGNDSGLSCTTHHS